MQWIKACATQLLAVTVTTNSKQQLLKQNWGHILKNVFDVIWCHDCTRKVKNVWWLSGMFFLLLTFKLTSSVSARLWFKLQPVWRFLCESSCEALWPECEHYLLWNMKSHLWTLVGNLSVQRLIHQTLCHHPGPGMTWGPTGSTVTIHFLI